MRADGDGDNFADIWRSEPDAFASIANYLRDAGWKANMLWGVPVRVPDGFNRAAVRNLTTTVDCPRVYARHSRPMTMAQWRAMGVMPISRSLRETDLAQLFEPDGPGETGYLVPHADVHADANSEIASELHDHLDSRLPVTAEGKATRGASTRMTEPVIRAGSLAGNSARVIFVTQL